jgi:hypothetical protein
LEWLKEAINQKLDASSGVCDTTEVPRAARTFAEKRTPWEKSSLEGTMIEPEDSF